MGNVAIRDVKVILTAPEGINLVVVKVETSEPGLYGLGCATFTQRCFAVATAIEQYLKPFLIGKDPSRIEDIWQTGMVSAYWRNGPVLNNAISGIDMALWDIKGKLANMPVYDLLGGKCREAAAVYRHADGKDVHELEDNVVRYMEQGYRYIRCQMGGYGGKHSIVKPENAPPGAYYDPDAYARSIPAIFEHLRAKLGFDIELLHDIHERLAPIEAIRVAKQLEQYRLFFLEDPLAPEQLDWFKQLRSQSATPIAMGELFVHPVEWLPLIKDSLIDFIRVHISAIGGITPAKKLAALSEAFGVRTAWHGPGDVSPVGHAANLHLDMSCINFGIQEWYHFSEPIMEVFPGCPEIRGGYAYLNGRPGLGIDIDEKKAASYPCHRELPAWTLTRAPDGSSLRP
ncbi:2-dehydro-3-deoxy-6-phosphogalactonate aldolase [Gordoniibacillus kamchatkensis]|uniref:2-dehydro-3-deoxy-6-phosphogalactonate aldolase n=1 Tax=Gordoniibacillus kamchatkensis TaxID=1590651 RepID=A0ABR5AK25_9BACL|nr:enolase C-terminal domain-like protein [Paenibacillus sp. VKM B-2647]KIL41315.1 2-dehydro-3-deoxy-6-phosphogalactonate aldolase [Paenibacillus sp. VKM B-2647]